MRPTLLFYSVLRQIILLCLMPDDFTHQGEIAAIQWVNNILFQS
jgi:hypothetical protein